MTVVLVLAMAPAALTQESSIEGTATVLDVTPPTITVNTPEGQWYSSNPLLDVNFADDSAVENCVYQVDNYENAQGWKPLTSDGSTVVGLNVDAPSFTANWYISTADWNALSEGSHTIYFKCVDNSGNVKEGSSPSLVIKKDTQAPSNPTASTQTPDVNVWTNDNTIDVSWSGATDQEGLSGVAGYYYVWDRSSATVPTTSDAYTTSTSVTSPPLADNDSWYLHVRACDAAGNLASGALHIGPFRIDTQTPAPSLLSPVNNVTISDSTPLLDWSDVVDPGSGLSHYAVKVDNDPDLSSPLIDTTTSTSSYPVETSLANGVWYWGVQAVDNVGNHSQWSSSSFRVWIEARLASSAWACARRDARNTGQSAYVGPADNAITWTHPDVAVWTSVALDVDNNIYFGSWDRLYSLNPNGTLRWSFPTGSPILTSPAVTEGGIIYFGCADGKFYAIRSDGTENWSYSTGGEIHSSPVIGDDGTVYFGSDDGKLYALDPEGTLKWSYTTADKIRSSPAIARDGTVYVTSYDGRLYALNPDGTLRWSHDTGTYIHSSPAVGADGTVYFAGDIFFYALNPNGTLRWAYLHGSYSYSSPAIGADNTVYFGSNNGRIYALRPDGSKLWSYATGGMVRGAPTLDSSGNVYFTSDDGMLRSLDPSGGLRWSRAIGKSPLHPVIASKMYVTSGSVLYAF